MSFYLPLMHILPGFVSSKSCIKYDIIHFLYSKQCVCQSRGVNVCLVMLEECV